MDQINLSPGIMESATPKEREFIENRMAKMSPKEHLITNAALQMSTVNTAAAFINLTFNLDDFEVCYPATDDYELGRFAAQHNDGTRESAPPSLDAEGLGRHYRERHPGLFCGGAYVKQPTHPLHQIYTGNPEKLVDDGYSMRVRLIYPENGKDVWLRLPDHEEVNGGEPDEIRIALDMLGAASLDECLALEAECVLPDIENLLSQYASLRELVWAGNNLGYVLEEQNQGAPYFMEHFLAALEYEHCTSLDFALDIADNLRCYDFLPDNAVVEQYGRTKAVENHIVHPGSVGAQTFDYAAYGHQQAVDEGMEMTRTGYITRNRNAFQRHFTAQQTPPKPVVATQGGTPMNPFERELRKMFADDKAFPNAKFIGPVCFGDLGGGNRIRVEFHSPKVMDQFDTLRLTIISQNDGPIDKLDLHLGELLQKRDERGRGPHLWRYEGKTAWKPVKFTPTTQDFQMITDTVKEYASVFIQQDEQLAQGGMSMQL